MKSFIRRSRSLSLARVCAITLLAAVMTMACGNGTVSIGNLLARAPGPKCIPMASNDSRYKVAAMVTDATLSVSVRRLCRIPAMV